MSCPRRIAVLTALEADALQPDTELGAHARDCPICAAAIAEAQLDALGHGPPDDDALDAVALAALGLGPLPADVELDEEPWLEALASAPAGAEPPMPPPPPSALSRPMAMIPADEMLDPPMPAVSEPLVDRRRWPVWLGGVGTALAAAVMLFTLVPTLREATDDTPAPPAATAPSEPTMGAAPAATPAKPAAPTPAAAAGGGAGDETGLAAGDEEPARPASGDVTASDDVKAAADEKAAAEGAAGEVGAVAEGADDDGAGEGEARADETPAARRRTRRAAPRPSPAPRTAAEPAQAPKPEPARRAPARRAPARPKKESTSEVDALLGALEGPGGGSKPAASAAPDGGDLLLPEQLDRRQILTVIKQHARGIQSCRGRGDPSGNVIVDLIIGPSGRVTQADVVGAHAGTPTAACVERKVRAMRFPQFNGEPMQIKMPFAL